MAKPLQLSCIGQISVTVHELGRAVAFYRDVLGMRLLFEVPPKMAFFDCGGLRLMLAVPEEPEFNHPSSTPPARPHEGPRSLDGLLPRLRGQHAGPHERGPRAAALK